MKTIANNKYYTKMYDQFKNFYFLFAKDKSFDNRNAFFSENGLCVFSTPYEQYKHFKTNVENLAIDNYVILEMTSFEVVDNNDIILADISESWRNLCATVFGKKYITDYQKHLESIGKTIDPAEKATLEKFATEGKNITTQPLVFASIDALNYADPYVAKICAGRELSLEWPDYYVSEIYYNSPQFFKEYFEGLFVGCENVILGENEATKNYTVSISPVYGKLIYKDKLFADDYQLYSNYTDIDLVALSREWRSALSQLAADPVYDLGALNYVYARKRIVTNYYDEINNQLHETDDPLEIKQLLLNIASCQHEFESLTEEYDELKEKVQAEFKGQVIRYDFKNGKFLDDDPENE